MRDVQVLSLDGLSVTAELVHDILNDPSFSVRILSIRGVKNLNEGKLRRALQYACRESRPEGTPRLKGLYVFGPQDAPPVPMSEAESRSPSPTSPVAVASAWNSRSQKVLAASLADEPEAWYVRRGDQFSNRISQEWASTLVACARIISFDSVLCAGPRHFNSPAWGTVNTAALDAAAASPSAASVPHFAVATHSLGGCASCGSAPEGWTVWGEETSKSHRDADGRRTSESSMADLARYPLLAPPPMHSASIHVAMCPTGQTIRPRLPFIRGGKQQARFIPRCFDCIRDRYCVGCQRWWCESCYIGPRASSPVESEGGSPGPNDVSILSPSSQILRAPRLLTIMLTGVHKGAHVFRSCWECGMNVSPRSLKLVLLLRFLTITSAKTALTALSACVEDVEVDTVSSTTKAQIWSQ